MNTERPHQIVQMPANYRTAGGKWLPLSVDEARMLQPMTEDQRAEWFAKLPRGERRRRQRAHDKALKDRASIEAMPSKKHHELPNERPWAKGREKP